jgi:ArsR family transcriptional regulator
MKELSLNTLSSKQRAFALKNKKVFLLLAETFQALGDPTRVKILWTLTKGELSVSELVVLLEMSQPAVSHHLRTLRNLHIVKVRKEGKISYYSIDDNHIENLIHEGITHVEDLL